MRSRYLLNAFLVSVAVNAVLGIWALLSDDFGSTQGKVLATSFCVSGAMLGVLVNGAPLARRLLWPIPVVAAVAAATGFGLMIVIVWSEPGGDLWWKLLVTLAVVASGATLVGLLALPSLRSPFEPLRLAHLVATGLLVVTVVAAVWFEFNDDWIMRLIGVESIVVAALTLTVPALARFLPPEDTTGRPLTRTGDTIVCQKCGSRLDHLGRVVQPTKDTLSGV